MSTETLADIEEGIIYPESDGKPMADNTRQFRWIVTIQGGFDALYRDNPNVFVAGDLLWYPVQGQPAICQAPDTMLVFGRPKGDRGSYLQWREEQIAPQMVWEVLSPDSSRIEALRNAIGKLRFYERYGVEEYYIYDPDHGELTGWLRQGDELVELEPMEGWVSPRTGVRFGLEKGELRLFRPDGQRFASYIELEQARAEAEARAAEDRQARAEAEARAAEDRQAYEQAQLRAERLAARQRELGIDPEN